MNMASGTNFMKEVAGKALDFVDDIGNFAYKNGKGDLTKLRSNKAINPIGKFLLGESDTGIRGTLGAIKEGKSFTNAVKGAYQTAEGGLNYKAIAGTYVGASLAGRVATGGGLYRDSTGNVNAPGIPFI